MSSKCKHCRQIARLERKLDETYCLLFATVRTAIIGLNRKAKVTMTDKQISEKVFETIAEMEKTAEYGVIRKLIDLSFNEKGDD